MLGFRDKPLWTIGGTGAGMAVGYLMARAAGMDPEASLIIRAIPYTGIASIGLLGGMAGYVCDKVKELRKYPPGDSDPLTYSEKKIFAKTNPREALEEARAANDKQLANIVARRELSLFNLERNAELAREAAAFAENWRLYRRADRAVVREWKHVITDHDQDCFDSSDPY